MRLFFDDKSRWHFINYAGRKKNNLILKLKL